uniref:Centrobin n=1 Tax=Leptobrachium leishanense TaxID=445787 RepID=A0A8C5MB74_9ANUR
MALPFSLQDYSILSGIEPLPLSSPPSPHQNVLPSPAAYSPSSPSLRRAATSEVTSQLYASLRRSQELDEEVLRDSIKGEETLNQGDTMTSEVDDLVEETSKRLNESTETSSTKESQFITQMESLRYHLQNTLSLNKLRTVYDTVLDKREDEHSDATSTLLNQRPVRPASPLSLSGLEALFPHYSTLYNTAPSLPDLQLRDALERETTRRKHLERHIQNLQNEMLELQQRLTVCVTADRRKDIMIQQLDQTLAVVVGGWKQQEKKTEEMMSRLQDEKQEAEQARLRDQEVLVEVRQELAQAVDALAKAEQAAAEEKRDLQSMVDEKASLAARLRAEREMEERAWAEGKRELETLRLQMQEQQSDQEEREKELQEECERLQEEKRRDVDSERVLAQQGSQKCQELQQALASLQGDIVRLEHDMQTLHRERDTLHMELNLQKARGESERMRLESEHRIRLEEAVTEKMSSAHEESARHLCAVREQHRKQLLELTSQHERELSDQLSEFKAELQEREKRHKDTVMEYEMKLSVSEDRSRELSAALRRLESERAEMLTQLQDVMKSHWSQALRVLTAKTSSDSWDFFQSQAAPFQATTQREALPRWQPGPSMESDSQEETKEQAVQSVGEDRESGSSHLVTSNLLRNSSSHSELGSSQHGDSQSQYLKASAGESQLMTGRSQENECGRSDTTEHNQTMVNRSRYLIGSSPSKDSSFQFLGGDHIRSRTVSLNSGEGQQTLTRSQSVFDSSPYKSHIRKLPTDESKTSIMSDCDVQVATTRKPFGETPTRSLFNSGQPITSVGFIRPNIFDAEYSARILQPLSFTDMGGFEANRSLRASSRQSVASDSHPTSYPAIPKTYHSLLKENPFNPLVDFDLSAKVSGQLGRVSPPVASDYNWASQHREQGPSLKQHVPAPHPRMVYEHREEISHQATDTEEDFYPMQMEELSHSFSSHMGFYPLEPIPDGATPASRTTPQISPERPFQEPPSTTCGRSGSRSMDAPQNQSSNPEQVSPNPLLQYYIRMLLDRTPGDPFNDELEGKSSDSHPGVMSASRLRSSPDAVMAEVLQSRAAQQARTDDNPRRNLVSKVPGAVKKEVISSQHRPAQSKVMKRVSARGGRPGVWK